MIIDGICMFAKHGHTLTAIVSPNDNPDIAIPRQKPLIKPSYINRIDEQDIIDK